MSNHTLPAFALLIGLTLPGAALANDDSCGNPSDSALAVAGAYLDTFNASDIQAHVATLQFPTYLVNDGGQVYDFSDSKAYAAMVREYPAPWHHEEFVEKVVAHQSTHKVHVRVKIRRLAEDNSVMGTHDSLWVIACRDGNWGIVVRSTFVSHEQ